MKPSNLRERLLVYFLMNLIIIAAAILSKRILQELSILELEKYKYFLLSIGAIFIALSVILFIKMLNIKKPVGLHSFANQFFYVLSISMFFWLGANRQYIV